VSDVPETFESLRPLLFAIAYRMLASVSDAEDVLQEAYLRYRRALDDGVTIGSLKAFLSTVVTRLALDHAKSAQQRREEYVGVWLPAPLLVDEATYDPAERAELADSVSMAFLLVLERLDPVERAVFLLHDVFGYRHDEIADIVEVSAVNSRQIATRARRRVQAERPRFESSPEERDRLAQRFFAAVTDGDVDGLVQLLAGDVVLYGDGGGKVPQWKGPIDGADRVARLFSGMGAQLGGVGLHLDLRRINGQPGALVRDRDGSVLAAWVLEISDGAVHTIRSVINPDKLRHIGPVADVVAITARRASLRT
jgi:RNA polymerase sigma-70 factor (ECF subfamily)